jgi:L-threonylcarbamoyladenylate synthase
MSLITEFYTLGSDPAADEAALERAAAIIREGGLVGMPTETVYGLGASALSAQAAEKIYAAKGRPSDNPLIVHVAFPEEAEAIAHTSELYYALAKRFMPGPLTVILPKKNTVPAGVTGGLDTVAVRCPSHPAAHALIRKSGVPIAAPSANRSGSPSPTTAQHVYRDMDGRIDMILDGGPCEIGLESTVIRLTEEGCEILRPGAVTEFMLAEVAGSVSVAKAVIDPALAGDKPLSPGMKYKHYSPNAEVVLVDGDDEGFAEYVRAHITDREAVAAADSAAEQFSFCNRLSCGKTANAEEASRALFSLLREADDWEYTRVYIQLPPPEGGYLALYNRLIRAAGGRIVHIK